MSQDEVAAVLKARQVEYDISCRYDWEQTRLKCFYTATAFGGSNSIKQPKDLFKLPWDIEETVEKVQPLTKDQFIERAKAVKQSIDNKNPNRAIK